MPQCQSQSGVGASLGHCQSYSVGVSRRCVSGQSQCQSQSGVGASVSVSVTAVSVSRRCLSVSLSQCSQCQSSVSQCQSQSASVVGVSVSVSQTSVPVSLIFMWGVSLTHPVLASFLCGEFLLHIRCWLHFYAGSFSYTSRAVFFFLFLSGEFLLHILCWLHFYVGSFSYTSHAGFFVSIWGVPLPHLMLASFLSVEFL